MYNFIAHLDYLIHLEFILVKSMKYGFGFVFLQKSMHLSPKLLRCPLCHIPNFHMYLGLLASFLFCSLIGQTWDLWRPLWPTSGWGRVYLCRVFPQSRVNPTPGVNTHDWLLNLSVEQLQSIRLAFNSHHSRLCNPNHTNSFIKGNSIYRRSLGYT